MRWVRALPCSAGDAAKLSENVAIQVSTTILQNENIFADVNNIRMMPNRHWEIMYD